VRQRLPQPPARIAGPSASDFHRPISAYLNELCASGCRIREIVEPGLDPAVAAAHAATIRGMESYVRLPNFLIVSADAPGSGAATSPAAR
jgi:hypothetical protein